MNTPSLLGQSPDEMLRQKLPAWLGARLGAYDVTLIETEQLVGGHSNETWKIVCTYRTSAGTDTLAFVMRWGYPDGLQAPYDIPGQFKLLTALSRTSIPVPEPIWLEADEALIGAPFLAMKIVGGITPNRFLTLDDPLRDAKLQAHVEMLARIHGLDWKRFGIDATLPPPTAEDCAGVALASVRARAVQRGLIQEPWVDYALSWLGERMPTHSEVGLLHGDPNLTNYRFDGSDIVAVLDWDAAQLCDPLWDVGAISGAMWLYFADQPPATQERERARFLDLYHQASGRSLGNLAMWETLFVLRAALLTYHAKMESKTSETFREKLKELTGMHSFSKLAP